MINGRHVALFRHGRSQTIRIPREFELAGLEAIIRKEGERLIIAPALPREQLLALLAGNPSMKDFLNLRMSHRGPRMCFDRGSQSARRQRSLRTDLESSWCLPPLRPSIFDFLSGTNNDTKVEAKCL